MSHHLNLTSPHALLIGMMTAVALLSACDKKSIITQPVPAKTETVATAGSAPTFTADSFSPKGLATLVEGEGKDYTKLPHPQSVQTAGKAEVLEFFWYGCPHCYAIEPAVEAWKKTLPANVVFKRYHVQWSAPMQAHQRMAMTVQALGKSDDLDMKIFNAIQEQGQGLSNDDAVGNFMVQNGIDRATWDKTYKSFDVNANIVTADSLFKAYNLNGVPDFIVNGKYLVQGDKPRVLQVVNKLLEQK